MSRRPGARGFCEHCEVSLDLHPSQTQTDDEWECESAESKARVLDMWDRMLMRVTGRAS